MSKNEIKVFDTPRLYIRLAIPTDAPMFYQLWTETRVMTNVGFPQGLRITEDEIKDNISKNKNTPFEQLLVVILKATGEAIGECKLHPPDDEDIASTDVKLSPSHWGNKYGVEVKTGLLAYLFNNTSCKAVQASPNVENTASIKMQEAVGGIRISEETYHFPESMRYYTRPVHHYIYRVHRQDWEQAVVNEDVSSINEQLWDNEVAKGTDYTRPWQDLDRQQLLDYADGKIERIPAPYSYIYPRDILQDVTNKHVLCLASGGGQQSAVFGLLGAKVTVQDLSKGQLQNDHIAANAHGYDVTTVHGDMRDLSCFQDEQFDIVYQAISICFTPDLNQIYRLVFRILKPQGLYRVGHVNPATVPVSFDGPDNGWDGIGYRISQPYVGGPILRKDDGTESMIEGTPTGEFRHLLSDIFNEIIQCGFVIKGLWEDPAGDINAEPGSNNHMRSFIQQYFSILAQKP